jgi:uncharacterized protein DUF3105
MESAEDRRQRRLRARADREQQAMTGRRKAQQRRRLTIGGVVILVVALLAAGISLAGQTLFRPPPGRTFANEGQTHVNPGAPLDFKTNPPTSGSHYPTWTRPGIYPEAQDSGNWVHSLEHGYVVLLYNCPDGCPDDVDKLRKFYESAPKSAKYGYQKLIVQPYANMPHMFAAVAWTHLEEMDQLNLDEIGAFYRAYMDHGPEDAS